MKRVLEVAVHSPDGQRRECRIDLGGDSEGAIMTRSDLTAFDGSGKSVKIAADTQLDSVEVWGGGMEDEKINIAREPYDPIRSDVVFVWFEGERYEVGSIQDRIDFEHVLPTIA